ncbi:MAG TPA: ABC transporter substrate-binding protein [Candidatus Limnocylindria bacterium]
MVVANAKTPWMRLAALLAVFAIVVAACTPAGDASDEASDEPPASGGASEPPASAGAGGDLGTYTLGIFQDVTTDNQWNSIDTAGNTVWNSYFLNPMLTAPYVVTMPGIEFVPDLADADLEPAVQDGDVWTGSFTLREAQWSDGEPITGADVAFTWNTAVDLELIGGWEDYADADIVTSVEADGQTVTVTFNAQPGLSQWGPGTSITQIPIQPMHFWEDVVEAAKAEADPRLTLLAASGADAPSGGATVFGERQEGAFAASIVNENYYDNGAEKTSGDATYTDGPFATDFNFPLYGGQEAAVLALADGEVDLLLNPLGMQRGFQDQVTENPDLTAIVNPTNGYRFLAFNHSRAPMSDAGFRDALTALIDKEFVTGNLLQGVAFPLYVILPEGNTKWYNAEVAEELKAVGYAGLDTATRRSTAINLLLDAGYTWEVQPGFDNPETGTDEEPVEERDATPGDPATWTFLAGQGLIGPDGEPVGQLRLVTPTASYDPLRATFANYISGVSQEMGIDLVAVPTDFNKIVNDVFAVDADNQYTSDFDMFILGYSLGSAAFPTFHGSFFKTGGDSNNTQYSSAEYDAFSAEFDSATNEEDAFAAMWEMERLIAADKPHVPLFDTGILEFYSNRVAYPFTDTLSGLQFVQGLQSSATAK